MCSVDHKTTSKSESEENFIFSMVTVQRHIIYIPCTLSYTFDLTSNTNLSTSVFKHTAPTASQYELFPQTAAGSDSVRDNGSRTHRKGVYLVPTFSHNVYIYIHILLACTVAHMQYNAYRYVPADRVPQIRNVRIFHIIYSLPLVFYNSSILTIVVMIIAGEIS